ncbi:phosphoribosylanthranilate isomerase [soil metagenome]
MKDRKKVILKVCGMKSSDNILEVAKLCPEYMGFIFFRGSKRYVGDEFIIPNEFPKTIRKVGVFVNDSTNEIIRLANKHRLDFIQLHGDELVTQCEELRGNGLKVIKAFSIDGNFVFEAIKEFKNHVDFFLFDTKGGEYGGNGVLFDWNILRAYDQQIPFFLSGGISVDNIENLSVLNGMNLHAIDVNSRVESSVAVKDTDLVARLIDKLKIVNQ